MHNHTDGKSIKGGAGGGRPNDKLRGPQVGACIDAWNGTSEDDGMTVSWKKCKVRLTRSLAETLQV